MHKIKKSGFSIVKIKNVFIACLQSLLNVNGEHFKFKRSNKGANQGRKYKIQATEKRQSIFRTWIARLQIRNRKSHQNRNRGHQSTKKVWPSCAILKNMTQATSHKMVDNVFLFGSEHKFNALGSSYNAIDIKLRVIFKRLQYRNSQ